MMNKIYDIVEKHTGYMLAELLNKLDDETFNKISTIKIQCDLRTGELLYNVISNKENEKR